MRPATSEDYSRLVAKGRLTIWLRWHPLDSIATTPSARVYHRLATSHGRAFHVNLKTAANFRMA
jgi:hypothetical protein